MLRYHVTPELKNLNTNTPYFFWNFHEILDGEEYVDDCNELQTCFCCNSSSLKKPTYTLTKDMAVNEDKEEIYPIEITYCKECNRLLQVNCDYILCNEADPSDFELKATSIEISDVDIPLYEENLLINKGIMPLPLSDSVGGEKCHYSSLELIEL